MFQSYYDHLLSCKMQCTILHQKSGNIIMTMTMTKIQHSKRSQSDLYLGKVQQLDPFCVTTVYTVSNLN